MIWLDSETFSPTPINHGTYRYASDAEAMIITWALNDEDVLDWDRTADKRMPDYLEYLIHDTDEPITAHNAMFDRNVLRLGDMRLEIPIPRWRCNMVRAMAHSLPGGIEPLGVVLGLSEDEQKIKDGKRLINLFCKPQPFKFAYKRKDFGSKKEYDAAKLAASLIWPGRATRDTHPEEWQRFLGYAKQDIVAMRALDKKIPTWNYNPNVPYVPGAPVFADINNPTELELYHLDQVINDRGLYMDVDLARAAVRAVEREKIVLQGKVQDNTGYSEELGIGVESATKRDQMLYHILESYGITLPDLQKDTLERRIADENLPKELRELLALRLSASTTSTSKYKALLNGVLPTNRLSGTMQFNGAGRTRRWAHRAMQTGNLPRPTIPQEDIDAGIEFMKSDCEDILVDDVMSLASSAIRGTIIAPPGKKLVITDLANIEGRDAAWLAGEEWKLEAFREYDTVLGRDGRWYTGPEFYAAALRREYIPLELDKKGEPVRKGPDLYKLSYAKSFAMAVEEVDADGRKVGKNQELMLQYQGSVGAFVTGSATVGIDLNRLATTAFDVLPKDIVEEAREFLEWVREQGDSSLGLSDEVFIVCNAFTRLWRRANPAITSLWKELEQAAIAAVENPGNTFTCRKFKLRRDGGWLRMRLPSGRYLCYPSPKVEKGKLSYMGVDQYTRRWQRINTYGGRLFENACQSLAGDVMKNNMPLINSEGYEIVLTVHDEVLGESPTGEVHTVDHMAALLASVPTWAGGMPLAAAGFSTQRYRKD